MPNDASLYFFTELLREARTLFRAMIASINLFVISQSFLFLSNVWTVWSGSTPNTIATAGVCLVFIPTLCFTVLLSDYESDCMKQMPDSFVSRDVFGISLVKGIGNILIPFVLMIALRVRLAPQNIVCVLLALSATQIHLVESISKISPVKNQAWKVVATLTLISSVGYMVVTCRFADPVKTSLTMALTVAGSESMKFFWRQKVYLSRRRAKLEFNTRLGMHSPR